MSDILQAIRNDARCQSRLKRTHFISTQMIRDETLTRSNDGPVYMVPKVSVIALSYPSRSELLSFSASTRRSNAMERRAVPLSYALHRKP
jgi:hypothetical protein